MPKPRIVILAGPNGAGKTTLAKYLLPDALEIDEFVNADQIAAGLSAFAPESVAFEAGRIMLRRIDTLIKEKRSFAFETTLSSKTFAHLAARARKLGYAIELIYVALPSAKYARRRVRARHCCRCCYPALLSQSVESLSHLYTGSRAMVGVRQLRTRDTAVDFQ